MSKFLSTSSEWTFDKLEAYDAEIARIAQSYQLDTYPVQLEVINSEQMLDAYSTVGMPLGYHHWSFGKHFVDSQKKYKHGHMGLAYEMVINSNPCIAYLMEENSMTMQAMVIAHACYGHNSFFKNNYLFKTWGNADSIIDYLLFARNYISECEEKHGIDKVESLLDACHALMNQGVDRYKRPAQLSMQEEKARQHAREAYLQSQVNDLWRTIPNLMDQEKQQANNGQFPSEPQENLLYFIEKNAPLLEPWQREIIRIVRKVAQYFYPQRQTKVMNEGWATFWHYTIITQLHAEGFVDDKFMLEFYHSHTDLITQLPFDHPHYSGINPYTLGFNIFQDIQRICQDPTEEDKFWFPNLANTDWIESLHFAMENFKDESFIAQYLSPKVIRDLKLFSILDDDKNEHLIVEAIHNDEGYQTVRQGLSNQYNVSSIFPNIQIVNVDIKGDRSITLHHIQHNRMPLHDSSQEVLKYLYQLWGFDIILHTVDSKDNILSTTMFPPKDEAEKENTEKTA